MKVKKYIGKTVNGFLVLDTYQKITPNGKKTRKVLLQCENCGRMFERQSGVDFEHIKCKCMCAPEPECKFHYLEYNGKQYIASELCRLFDVSVRTVMSRIERGYSVEDALKIEYVCTCQYCGKEFETKRAGKKYCSSHCSTIASKRRRKPLKEFYTAQCVVCGSSFETNRSNSKTCSDKCRKQLSSIERNGRYKHLKVSGRFDQSVTLNNVYDRFSGICQICGKHLTFDCSCISDDYPSIDHIIPLSKGGSHEWKNVQLLCRKCNYTKSDLI